MPRAQTNQKLCSGNAVSVTIMVMNARGTAVPVEAPSETLASVDHFPSQIEISSYNMCLAFRKGEGRTLPFYL